MATANNAKSPLKTGGLIAAIAAVIAALSGTWVVLSDDSDGSLDPTQLEVTELEEQDGSGSVTALAALEQIPIAERDFSTPYDRNNFGEGGWVDLDNDGCTPRNEILARDLEDVSYRPGTGDCVVEFGTLIDPYSGEVVEFQRGPETSQLVQIDHVVSLSDAWHKGAQEISEQDRIELANDPLNLVAVSGDTNFAKGNLDASEWLPPREDAHCTYAATQVSVKLKYDLWMTAEEHAAVGDILAGCPNQPLLGTR